MKPLALLLPPLLLVGCDSSGEAVAIPFAEADVPPEPAAGWAGVSAATEYPEMARRAGVGGEVRTSLVVGRDGTASDLACTAATNQMLCDAAYRALEEAAWVAGREAGERVAVEAEACHQFEIAGEGTRIEAGWCAD